MRFYEINLYRPGSTKAARTWSSFPSGQFDPGALDVEFDIVVQGLANPAGGSQITIHGIALQDLMQPQQFGPQVVNNVLQAGWSIELLGGMGKGLPLSNPAQQGRLIKGQVWQSFGAWQGTEMRLDLVINPGGFDSSNPGNFVLNWQAGQPLSAALKNCLSTVYPANPLSINISDQLVQAYDDVNFCGTPEEMAQYVKSVTAGQFLGASYPGVDISINSGSVDVQDFTQAPAATIQINFTDLVGQPTWLDVGTMQLMVVMRGDVKIGTYIKMPQGFTGGAGVTTFLPGNNSSSGYNYNLTLAGTFYVSAMRHIGHFRSSSGMDWVTVLNCTPTTLPGSF